jgi:hypothetical protein
VKRYISKVQLGQSKVQEQVQLVGDECPGPDDGYLGFKSFWEFIVSLQCNPTLLRHSVDCPSELKMYHNGHSWVVETKVVIDAQNNPA